MKREHLHGDASASGDPFGFEDDAHPAPPNFAHDANFSQALVLQRLHRFVERPPLHLQRANPLRHGRQERPVVGHQPAVAHRTMARHDAGRLERVEQVEIGHPLLDGGLRTRERRQGNHRHVA